MGHPGSCKAFETLWRRLEEERIPYCALWCGDSLASPDGDYRHLELLSDRGRSGELDQLLTSTGFKPARIPAHHHPGSIAYVGFGGGDEPLSRLIVRFDLFLADACRSPRLEAWGDEALRTRIREPVSGCHVPAPEMAALLLALWAKPDRLGGNRAWRCLHEHQGLTADRPGVEATAALAGQLLGGPAVRALEEVFAGSSTSEALARFQREARTCLSLPGRARDWFGLGLLRIRRHGQDAGRIQGPVALQKGFNVAFVGSDGSGKSTMISRVAEWLGRGVRVKRIYMGSGQGASSVIRWPLLMAYRLISKSRTTSPARASGPSAGPATRRSLLRRFRPLWALALAREKLTKLRRARIAREEGFVVLCDRYPQNEIMGFNDGPLLSEWTEHGSAWRRALARWERKPYGLASKCPPDLVIKLDVSAGIALARKPDMTAEEIQRRIQAVDTLSFGTGTETVKVDADAPIEEVTLRIKEHIWSRL